MHVAGTNIVSLAAQICIHKITPEVKGAFAPYHLLWLRH